MKKRIEFAMGIILIMMVCFLSATANMSAIGKTSNSKNKKEKIRIAIDAGHGGCDPGKISAKGILEKDINLEIAKKLKEILEEEKNIDKHTEIEVLMVREDDNDLHSEYCDNYKKSDMYNRMRIVNESKANVLVSIHQNSYPDSSVRGIQIFKYNNSDEGGKLADCIYKSFIENISKSNVRETKNNSDYYILKHSKCPAIIIECGFLSNKDEAWLLTTEKYQQEIALAIEKGIKEYINNL